MHTIFINTSENVSPDLYQDVLFEKLLEKKELIIPDNLVQIDDMQQCAVNLARVIDQEADITEDASLIVFIDSMSSISDDAREVMPEDSQEAIRPQAFADETLLSMKVEASLARTLCAMGKRPKELIFVFGEYVKRNRFLSFDSVFREDMYKRMWERIRFSPCDQVLASIKALEETETFSKKKDHDKSLSQIIECLAGNRDSNQAEEVRKYIITEKDGECYDYLLTNTAESILYHLERSNTELDKAGLYQCLNNAIELYVGNVLRNEITGQYAESIRYMYLPMEYRDIHETHRSVFRLLMYVYATAYSANHHDVFDITAEKEQIALQEKEFGALHALPIPSLDYEKLKELLFLHIERCRNSVYLPALPPQDLNGKVSREEKLIISEHDVPELVPKSLFDKNHDVVHSRISAFIPDCLKNPGFTVPSLRKAVESTYETILEKSASNQDQIKRYLNRASSEYDRIKDDALRSIPITDTSMFVLDPGSPEAEKKIDDLKNMENDLHEKLIRKEQQLLQARQKLVSTKDISQLVEETRCQTDYYFKSLKRTLLLMFFCLLFILVVLIPYVVIMNHLLTVPEGYLFFVVTGAVTIAALIVGYETFSRIYKNKILRLVRKVRLEFVHSQRNNQECLEQYTDLLYKLIPGYYAEKHYERLLHNYKVDTERRMEQIAYHEKSRKQRIRLIQNLLDNLDFTEPVYFTEDETVLTVDPEKDRIENGEVYILSADEVNSVQIRGKEQNDE